ncbi:hypothetical protein CYMTET_18909 [Cymbomonas tetramitiformis]|uniref:Sialyltransferase-like protein n=1 Tax=Cymbomonas tetramitiformis TaxID=36881 RepID=A0AAE0G7I2_9CHLO|nr:hypothetical protein CYMTET_18909 [Cymbomonas tetramitiformis]
MQPDVHSLRVVVLLLLLTFRLHVRAQELDAEEGLLDLDIVAAEGGHPDEIDENSAGVDAEGELERPPKPKARSARPWMLKLASVPRNCSNTMAASRPTLERLPVKVPPNRVALKDLFVTRDNYNRLGLTGLQYPHSLPPNASAIARRYKWRTCAVVGNSGTLLDSQYGASIDKHDVVIRMNQAPTKGYEPHVGRKTTFRIMNSLWSHRYAHGYAPWDPGFEHLPLEQKTTLIMSRVTVTVYNSMFEFWRKRRPDITLLLLSSRVVSVVRQVLTDYRARLCRAGYGPYLGGNTPSSGYMGVYLALQMCGKVSTYGFGINEVGGEKVSYHYYKGYAARKFGTDVHTFEVETYIIEALQEMGYVKLCKHNYGEEQHARRGYMPEFHKCGVA